MNLVRCSVLAAIAATGSLFAADATLLSFAPPDTKMAAGIYVDRTRNTPFGQFVLNRMRDEDGHFKTFITSTGFDPRQDLNEVLIFSNSVAAGPGANHPSLVVARGIFNGAQMLVAAKAQGGIATLYKGVNIVQKSTKDKAGFAILDGAVAVAGDLDNVKAAIDRRKQSSVLPGTLSAKISQVSSQFDAWFVASGFANQVGSVVGGPRGGDFRVDALQSIQQSSGGVKFGAIVQVSGEALTRSEKDAQALADVARFLSGMAANAGNGHKGSQRFASIFQSVNVQTQGSTVKLDLSVPESDLEQLLQPRSLAARSRTN